MYAEAQRNLREYQSAMNHLHRAIELDGRQIQLWYAMILTAWEGEDWKSLNKALESVKAMGGDNEIIQRFSILLEVKTGIPNGPTTEACDRRIIALLQDAVRTLGPEPDLMYALAEQYLKTGLLEAAVTWFEKIILIQKDHERAYLGEIAAWEGLLKDGDTKAAKNLQAAYDRYLELWPDNRGIRRDRALFLIRRGEFKKAAAELEALLPWEPANPTLRRVLAYAYRKTGRYREAAFFLKSLLKEKPDDTGLLLEYTGCLTRAGAAGYAATVLEKALALFSHSAEVSLTLGALFYREKKIERAFDVFREAAAQNRKDPRPYQWMAKISRQLGDQEGAARYDYEANNREKTK
jgi:tetratricopeptide (TPR) repeat protein